MNFDRAIEKAMKDPEVRVKLYIAFNLGLVAVNLFIVVGLAVLFLRIAGII
ncbi:hypothetical protein BMS3Abin16_01186 [archaeon BMS3Abin16]|nr:hypothetical protein BMS3Abin16_01186 [archaeon BMS3Abin16]